MIHCVPVSNLRVRKICWNADTHAGMKAVIFMKNIKRGKRKKQVSPLIVVPTVIYVVFFFLFYMKGCSTACQSYN